MYGALSSTVACTSQSYDSSGHVLLLTTWLYVFIAVTFVTLIANLFPCDHNHLLKYLLCIMWPVVGVSWFVTYLTLANVFVRFRSGQLGLGLAFAVVYTAYLAMNTQHIASNQEEDLSVDEYGYAAIVLAVDVMNVSLFMVTVYDVID
ncbi:Hypothetical protein CINCED_3A002449 [Cinara cedri]|uniref:Uncharacterized protein n=1 Tax=Cinara cedri TaxID=506608 RepID=A0A5E4M2H1_9HEMI|nr:Hypothetical protein CINCED_3A002449 [Cinara cedri]